MDLLTCGGVRRLAGLGLASALLAAQATPAFGTDAAPGVAVKAALVFNFVKFTEWPALAAGAPIVACVANDDDIASALAAVTDAAAVSGHKIVVSPREMDASWDGCHVLFVGEREMKHFVAVAPALRTKPVLTVSDAKGFSTKDGIIELYLEEGRMRFAVNVDAADRAGLRLSSRLLGLSRVVRDGH
jgi:hypothetical protein